MAISLHVSRRQGPRLPEQPLLYVRAYAAGPGIQITASGGVGYDSLTTRWLAITGGTGTNKGAFGTVRMKNFAQSSTPFTFYVIR